MSGIARFGVTGGRPMKRFEIEVEVSGAWSEANTGTLYEIQTKGYKVEIDAAGGSAYRVRHTEFYAGVESPFSAWSVPGVLVSVPEPSAAASLITLALLLAAMKWRRA